MSTAAASQRLPRRSLRRCCRWRRTPGCEVEWQVLYGAAAVRRGRPRALRRDAGCRDRDRAVDLDEYLEGVMAAAAGACAGTATCWSFTTRTRWRCCAQERVDARVRLALPHRRLRAPARHLASASCRCSRAATGASFARDGFWPPNLGRRTCGRSRRRSTRWARRTWTCRCAWRATCCARSGVDLTRPLVLQRLRASTAGRTRTRSSTRSAGQARACRPPDRAGRRPCRAEASEDLRIAREVADYAGERTDVLLLTGPGGGASSWGRCGG